MSLFLLYATRSLVVVHYNTVLSNLSSIGRPDLVQLALGDAAATVEEIHAELQSGIKIGKLPDKTSYVWSWGETRRALGETSKVY